MQLSSDAIWNLNQKDLLELIESNNLAPKSKQVSFYAPSFSHYKTKYYSSSPNRFPTISVTGNSCGLNCSHCGGKVLETMHSAISPKELFELCMKLKQQGAEGCLVSGGCLPDGSVPLKNFGPTLKKVKEELGLTVYVHTGIINYDTALMLKNAGIDSALIDIIGSKETAEKVCRLSAAPEDYANSLKALDKSGVDFVPHVIVGLNEGKLDGEFQALKMIKEVKPSAIVIIAFMPIHGTAMAKTKPPTPSDIVKVVLMARLLFPETRLALGCMRPKGLVRNQIDVLALKVGVDAIAFPSEEAIKYAQSEGYDISFSSYCCAK